MEKKKVGRPMRRWDGPKDVSEGKRTPKKMETNVDLDEAVGQNLETGFNLRVGDLPIADIPGGDKNVFMKNIKFLIEQNRMKPATVAKEAGISFELLRQWLGRGLRRPQKDSWDSIDRLRKFFWLNSMADLWSNYLIDNLKQTQRRAAEMQPFLQNKDWPFCVKFMKLLQSGEYDFLRDLIEKLNRQLITPTNQPSHGNQEAVKLPANTMTKYMQSRKAEGGHHP
jgi:hypothetical protein